MKAVVRVIAITTKHEDQERRNVSLFCLCHYDDGRPVAMSTLLQTPDLIGNISSNIVRILSFTVIPYIILLLLFGYIYIASHCNRLGGDNVCYPASGAVVAFLLFWRHLQLF